MKIRFHTGRGIYDYDAPSLSSVVGALDYLTDEAEAELRTGEIPPLYQSGARYARERGEHWRTPSAVLASPRSDGRLVLDCEDAVAWRTGELRASGEDPGARSILVRVTPRLLHAMTMRSDGSVEDPSAMLGMRTSREPKVVVGFVPTPDRRGKYARVKIRLADGRYVVAQGVGAVNGAALADALDRTYPVLAGLPAVMGIDHVGSQLLQRIVVGAGTTLPDLSMAEQAARDAIANPNPETIGRTLNEARNVVETAGGDWEKYAKAALMAGCAAGLSATGFGAALAPLCGLLGPLWDWIKGAITTTIYPVDDFMKWALERAGIQAEKATDPAVITTAPTPDPWSEAKQKLAQAGYFPIYTSQDLGKRDALAGMLEAIGWTPQKYGRRYEAAAGAVTRYYGGILLYNRDMTGDALKLAASQWGTPADRAATAPIKEKAKAIILRSQTGLPPGTNPFWMIDSAYWGALGIFPKMPGSAPQWLLDKARAANTGTAFTQTETREEALAHSEPVGTSASSFAPASTPTGGPKEPAPTGTQAPTGAPSPLAPPLIDSTVADFIAAAERLVGPGRGGDWLAMARLADTLGKVNRNDPLARAARAMLR